MPRISVRSRSRKWAAELREPRVVLAAGLTALALVWALILVAAPYAAADGRLLWLTASVYELGSLICHQRAERSFHLAGVQMPVCARCFGLYAAGALGLLAAWGQRRQWSTGTTRWVLAVAALPIAASVALEFAGAMSTSNAFRCATGLPLGFAAGLVFVGLLRPPADMISFRDGHQIHHG